jgi:hypothetical protein
MWRRVGLVRTNILEDCPAAIFMVERVRKLGNALAVTSVFASLYCLGLCSSHSEEGDEKFLLNTCSNKTLTSPNLRIRHCS